MQAVSQNAKDNINSLKKKGAIWVPFTFTEATPPVCSGAAQTLPTPLQSGAVRAPVSSSGTVL